MRRRRVKPFALSLVAAVCLFAARAHASDPIAERLYNDGRAAAQAKDWDRACTLFQQSQNREPAPGTLLNLADCEEHRGKLVTAAAQYRAAARLFRAGDRRVEYAKERAASLEKRVAKLRLRLDGEGRVESGGVLVDAETFGNSVTMDPGEHVFVVSAEGRAPMRTVIRLEEGESREVTLTLGAPLSAAPSGAPASPVAERAAPTSATAEPAPMATSARPAEAPARSWLDSRATAYGALGLGAVGIAVGAWSGLSGLASAHDVRELCPGKVCPSDAAASRASEAASHARTMAVVSTIGFGAGLAAAGVGTYLLLRTPSKVALTPTVGEQSVGLLFRGTL
jgi:hypothetical protein